jgi:hypothetical protein
VPHADAAESSEFSTGSTVYMHAACDAGIADHKKQKNVDTISSRARSRKGGIHIPICTVAAEKGMQTWMRPTDNRQRQTNSISPFVSFLITTNYADPFLSFSASCGGIPARRAVGRATAGQLLTHIADTDGHGANVDAKGLEHLIGLGVDLNGGNSEGRLLGDDVHAALALLLLKAQGNAANRAAGDALHGVSDVSGNLVAQALGRDDSDLVAKLLVHVEIISELAVPLLNDRASGFLDCLGANATLRE